METWQFSLFFAAFAIGFVLVHVRVARFEEHLRGLSMLRSIDERILTLPEKLPRVDVDQRLERIEQQMLRLREAIEDLRETTEQVGETLGAAIVRIPPPQVAIAADGAAAAPSPSAADRAKGAVEARLLQMGFCNLRILNEPSAQESDADIEVQVECERRHMPYKGRVLVRNGAIRDVALQSVATSFP